MSTSAGGRTGIVAVKQSDPQIEDREQYLAGQLDDERKRREQLEAQLQALQQRGSKPRRLTFGRGKPSAPNTAKTPQSTADKATRTEKPAAEATSAQSASDGKQAAAAPRRLPVPVKSRPAGKRHRQTNQPAAAQTVQPQRTRQALFAFVAAILAIGLFVSSRFFVSDETEGVPVAAKVTFAALAVVAIGLAVNAVRFNQTYPDWALAGKPHKLGPRRVLWWAWIRLNLYKVSWIPQPRPHGLHWARIIQIAKLARDNRKQLSTIVAVLTLKGGAGKTTVATYFAAALHFAIKISQVFLLDLDHAMSKVIKRFGQPDKYAGESITVKEAMTLIVDNPNSFDGQFLIDRTMSDSETGVMFFDGTSEADPFPETPVYELTKKLWSLLHTVVIDNRPSLSDPSVHGAVNASKVRIIPGKIKSDEEMTDIERTLTKDGFSLSEWGYEPDPADPDRKVMVIKKADPSVIVVLLGVPWHKCNTRTQYEMARRFGLSHDPSRLVLWPSNHRMVGVKRVSLWRLSPRALYAVFKLIEVHARLVLAQQSTTASPLPLPLANEVIEDTEPVQQLEAPSPSTSLPEQE